MPVYKCVVVLPSLDSPIAESKSETRLVEAKNEARAIAHIVQKHVAISRPTNRELVDLGADGIQIETAE